MLIDIFANHIQTSHRALLVIVKIVRADEKKNIRKPEIGGRKSMI